MFKMRSWCKITSQPCVKSHSFYFNISALPATVHNFPVKPIIMIIRLIDAVVPSTHERAKALMVRVTVALPFLAVSGQFSAAAERVALTRLPTKVVRTTD